MSDAERLEEFIKKAYTDPDVLAYLERNHFLHWRRVIAKIVSEHFERLKNESN